MRRTLSSLAALLVVAGAASSAQAQYPGYPCCPPRMVPDACGAGYYNQGPYGMIYGPNYWVHPPCMPFNGLLPQPPWAAQAEGPPPPPEFVTHPYARGPRDYFMYEEPR